MKVIPFHRPARSADAVSPRCQKLFRRHRWGKWSEPSFHEALYSWQTSVEQERACIDCGMIQLSQRVFDSNRHKKTR